MKNYAEFNNGMKMPLIGLGTWQATDPTELEVAIDTALNVGYRHFDTAYMYENEAVLGRVLKKWLDSGKVQRQDLFIVTKLPPIGMRPNHVSYFLEKSLKSLQLDFVDLYLIHTTVGFNYVNDTDQFPLKDGKMNVDFSTDLEAIWKAMEDQVDKGWAKAIGLSNFAPKQIERIVKVSRIQPANLQVELNASFQQRGLVELCNKLNITVCAFAPIGSPGRKTIYEKRGLSFDIPPLLDDPVVVEVAKQKDKTPAQILLRYLIQKNIIVIPKSVNPDRIKQNFQVFEFELDDQDMSRLDALDQGAAGRTFKAAMPCISDHPEYQRDY